MTELQEKQTELQEEFTDSQEAWEYSDTQAISGSWVFLKHWRGCFFAFLLQTVKYI